MQDRGKTAGSQRTDLKSRVPCAVATGDSAREAARRMTCNNNFKQIGIAVHNYHAAFKQLPTQLGGTTRPRGMANGNPERFMPPTGNNVHFLSAFVGLTPFLEQQGLWEQIANPYRDQNGNIYQAMGPTPQKPLGGDVGHTASRYDPWLTEIPTLRCPSDPGSGLPAQGRSNYAVSLGDASHLGHRSERLDDATYGTWRSRAIQAAQRGFFIPGRKTKFRDTLDGLSNTVAMGEIATDLGDNDARTKSVQSGVPIWEVGNSNHCQQFLDPQRPQFWAQTGVTLIGGAQRNRGFLWAFGVPLYTGINTIRPPNSELCLHALSGYAGQGIFPPSSRHQGGCHVLMGDGAVIFITDSIESGNQESAQVRIGNCCLPAGSQSPFGLWGALGTRASRETIQEQLNQ